MNFNYINWDFSSDSEVSSLFTKQKLEYRGIQQQLSIHRTTDQINNTGIEAIFYYYQNCNFQSEACLETK